MVMIGLFACAGSSAPMASDETLEMEPLEIEVSSESCSLDGLSAYFGGNSASIDPPSHAALDAVAGCLQGPLRNTSIELVGRTDTRGSTAYNVDLAHRRAESVERYLLDRGVTKDRMLLRSEGESATANARRVDILILDCAVDPARTCI
jgi:outer membrane protein OmpA-like peptidoglycan-associated protein